jgi:hypothetical protein
VNVSVTTAKDNVTRILINPRLATLENKQLRVYHGGSSQDHLFVLQCKMIMHGKWTYNYESAKCLAPLVIPRMYTKFLNCLNSSRGLREAVERLFQKNLSTQEDFIAEYETHKKDVTKSCYQELLAQANCVHTATSQAEAVKRCHGNTSSFSIIRPAAGLRLQKQDAFPSIEQFDGTLKSLRKRSRHQLLSLANNPVAIVSRDNPHVPGGNIDTGHRLTGAVTKLLTDADNWVVGNVAATACAPGAVGSAACTYGANMMYSGSGIDQRFDNYVKSKHPEIESTVRWALDTPDRVDSLYQSQSNPILGA